MDAAVAALLGVGITAVAQTAMTVTSHILQSHREARLAAGSHAGQRQSDLRDLYARFLSSTEDLRMSLLGVAGTFGSEDKNDEALTRARDVQADFHRLYYEVDLVAGSSTTRRAAAQVQTSFGAVLRGLDAARKLPQDEEADSFEAHDEWAAVTKSISADLEKTALAMGAFSVSARRELGFEISES